MATSSSSSTSKSWHWWVNIIAFISLIIIGIVLFFSDVLKIGGGDFTNFLTKFANALAYIVVAACAFVYAYGKMKKKNGIWFMVAWILAVILITITMIIPAVS